ncbi:MAG: alcohol dehydrogenase catalytic domain-containing protein [Acidimicrobiales bacterium]
MVEAQNRGVRFAGGGVVEPRIAPLYELAPEKVRVAVAYCGLCGSDRRLLESGAAQVPGHEIAGVVAEVGEGASSTVGVGERVVIYIPLFCGECGPCTEGWTNRCRRYTDLVGWQVDGGLEEVVDLPARVVVPVPADLELDVAVLALDTLGTSGHGLRMAMQALGRRPRSVYVIGCGPLGLGTLAVARELGVGDLFAFDLNRERLGAARQLGATMVDPGATAADGYELVVDVTGSPVARSAGWAAVAPGGALLLLGEGETGVELPSSVRWRRTDMFVIRSFYFPLREMDENWRILRQCGSELRDLMVTIHPFESLSRAFTAFREGSLLKPVIEVVRGDDWERFRARPAQP